MIPSLDQKVINRQTYSLLDFMGDMGGLNDTLSLLGMLIVLPFVSAQIDLEILNSMFMFKPASGQSGAKIHTGVQEAGKSRRHLAQMLAAARKTITEHFAAIQAVPRKTIFRILASSRRDRKRHLRLLKLSKVKFTKEMDLFKFIRRQRFVNFAVLSLLSGGQTAFASKLSYPVLRESTDMETASEEENKINWGKDSMLYLKKMQASANPADLRLF